MLFDPGSPLEAIRRQFPLARVDFDDGSVPARAAEAAAKAEAVILFVDQYMTESADAPSLNLPGRQDQLVEAVTRANPRSAIVLETGGPVLMPWLEQTGAVLEAWYPGQRGGEAIAEIFRRRRPVGTPAGHLPRQRRSIAPPEDPGRPERRADRTRRTGRTLWRDVHRYVQ